MKHKVTINNKDVAVSFTRYFDTELGDFLFKQVMCDVYMPGNEAVPIDVEKEQIRRIVEGFKKRKELYDEIPKETIRGKAYYVINQKMRFDLEWLKGRKVERPIPLAEHERMKADAARGIRPVPAAPREEPGESERPEAEQPVAPEYKDNRRKFLLAKGFKHNLVTNNWEVKDIRFPDAKIDKSPSDEEFEDGMNRLLDASYRNHLQLRAKRAKSGPPGERERE